MTGTNPPYGQHDPYSQQQQNLSGGWYAAPANPPPPPPRTGMSTSAILLIVFGSIAALCVLAGIGVALAPPPKDKPAAVTDDGAGSPAPYDAGQPAPTSAKTAAAATPAGPLASFADGTREVGTGAGQVAPGKYKTTVPSNSWGCYWERLSGTGGSFDEIIANGNAAKNTPVIVTIAAADKAFKSERCGTWSPA